MSFMARIFYGIIKFCIINAFNSQTGIDSRFSCRLVSAVAALFLLRHKMLLVMFFGSFIDASDRVVLQFEDSSADTKHFLASYFSAPHPKQVLNQSVCFMHINVFVF